MHLEVLQEYKLGDMVARYLIDRNSMQVGFQLLPENVSQEHIVTDNCFMESLIQYKLTGDIYNEAYISPPCLSVSILLTSMRTDA